MKESTKKIVTLISLGLGVIIAILAIMFAINQEKFNAMFDVAFWCILAMIVCSLLIWLVFGILKVIERPKKALIFLGIAVVVILGSFLLAGTDSMPAEFLARYDTTEGTARLIATACYTTYFVVIAALVLMVYAEIAKAFKK